MLVVGPQRLDESHRGQPLPLQILEEVVFVLQMSRRYRVARTILEWSVVVVVGKGLVVPLKQRIDRSVRRNHAVVRWIADRAGQRVVPATGVPLPTDMLGTEAVADVRNERAARIGRVVVIQGRQ